MATLLSSSIQNASYQALLSTPPSTNYSMLLRSRGIYQRQDLLYHNVFYIFPRMDPYNAVTTTREYVFFTKPDLHIFNNKDLGTLNPDLANVTFFYDLMRRGYNQTVLKDLQYSADTSTPFVRMLTNLKTSSLDLSSVDAEEIETGTNMYGTKIIYRKSSLLSDDEYDFTVEFEDTKYLDVYLWFKAFDEYERRKYLGQVSPPDPSYTTSKILHDQMGIFKFIVGEDGETLIHWSQMFGCYPKSVPREAFSDLTAGGVLKIPIQWKCSFIEDMQPNTITDFNYLAAQSSSTNTAVPLYNSAINSITGENVLVPYIEDDTAVLDPYRHYKLKWKA